MVLNGIKEAPAGQSSASASSRSPMPTGRNLDILTIKEEKGRS